MSKRKTRRLNFSLLTFLFFGLALSVFTWGLQYKLSLYDPPQSVSHSIPTAKLLSKDEQATVVDGETIADTAVPAADVFTADIFLFVFLVSSPLISLVKRLIEQEAEPSRSMSRLALMTTLFFRPPPAFI
jgi:hypothetical protein